MSKGIIFRNSDNEKIYPCPFYPIGSLYFSTATTNPSTYFGGTWERYGKGRTIVSIDESQSEFNTSGKTGGSKYLQSHMHEVMQRRNSPTAVGSFYNNNYTYGQAEYTLTAGSKMVNTGNSDNLFTNNSGRGNSGNLQPYIAVYVWRRIS